MKAALFAACALSVLAPLSAFSQTPSRPPAKQGRAAESAAASRARSILDSIQREGDFPRGLSQASGLFDSVISVCPTAETEAFTEAAFAVRLLTQLSMVRNHRAELLAFLKKNDELARDLVFLIKPEDKVPGVYAALDLLRERHGDELNKHHALVAAICVVHDSKFVFRVNENSTEAPDALAIYDFFATRERSMAMPLAKLTPDLLVSVVDVTSSIDELAWAHSRYAGDVRVGQRYFDVKYDTEAFRAGAEKKVTKAGFNLPNILQFGGVCADQAYFAMEVGKSIGIPTAYVSGRNAEVAHAWVGFVESKNGKLGWNFDSGHYEGYKGVRGEVLDPQTRGRIADSELSPLTESAGTSSASRHAAVAMTDAMLRLAKFEKNKSAFPPAKLDEALLGRTPVRQAAIADRLELLEAGLRKHPTYAPGWSSLASMAAAGELSLADKKRWAKVLDNLCGAKHPDFSLDILRPMVHTVEDTRDQDALWNSLFTSYQKRPDLAAEVRFAQGTMWEKAGDRSRAWDCFQDVIKRFVEDGPFAVQAAKRCERLLLDGGKPGEVAPMYAGIWTRLGKPKGMAQEFMVQSNWFQVGALYAARLDADRTKDKAAEVRDKLGLPRQ